jgi:hypothetical protein
MFHNYWRIFPIAIKFRVVPMIYFDSSNFKSLKKNKLEQKKNQNGGQNRTGHQA